MSVEIPDALGPIPGPAGAEEVPLSAQRLAVLDHLRAHPPVRVVDISADLGLHPNTIREHLDALVKLGLADRGTRPTGGRGRPAAWYRPSASDPATQVRALAGLATVLAAQLARGANPERDADVAGAAWGRALIDASMPEGGNPRRVVLDELSRLGFAPDEAAGPGTADEGRGAEPGIALRRCPLLDAARRQPDVVCRVHLGMVTGMLESLGSPATADVDLVGFAEPGACRLFLPDPDAARR